MGVRRPRWACGAVALAKELAWGFFILLAFMKPPIAPFIFLAFLCGRFTKMVEVAVRVLRRIIAMLLAKHQRLHVMPMPQGGGRFSDREVCSITYYKKFGQGMRVYACPEMLEAA